MEKRTNIQFTCNFNVWPSVERWALENKFNLKENNGAERLYQKGTGLMVAPSMLTIKQENQTVTMEAWLKIDFLTRLMSLFILPAEIGIQSGGAKAIVPRNTYRKQLNLFLERLGLPLIS